MVANLDFSWAKTGAPNRFNFGEPTRQAGIFYPYYDKNGRLVLPQIDHQAWSPNQNAERLPPGQVPKGDDDDGGDAAAVAGGLLGALPLVGNVARAFGVPRPGIGSALKDMLGFGGGGTAGLPTTVLGENVAPLGGGSFANVTPSMDIPGGLPTHLADLLGGSGSTVGGVLASPEYLASGLDYLGLGGVEGDALVGGMGADLLGEGGVGGLFGGAGGSLLAASPLLGLGALGLFNAMFGNKPTGGSESDFRIGETGPQELGRDSWGIYGDRRPQLDAFADPFYGTASGVRAPDWLLPQTDFAVSNTQKNPADFALSYNANPYLEAQGLPGLQNSGSLDLWRGTGPQAAAGALQGWLADPRNANPLADPNLSSDPLVGSVLSYYLTNVLGGYDNFNRP